MGGVDGVEGGGDVPGAGVDVEVVAPVDGLGSRPSFEVPPLQAAVSKAAATSTVIPLVTDE